MNTSKRYVGYLLILPSLLGITLFYVIPFFESLYYVFTQGVTDVQFVGFQNVRELLGNSVFRQAVANTGKFLIVAVPLVIGLALMLSITVAKGKFTWQRWMLLMPMVIPASSLCVSWRGFWGTDGIVNKALHAMGFSGVDFLKDWAFPMLIFLYILKNVGYISVILTSAIQGVPKEYQEAYRLDSNSEAGYVRWVLLPQILPTMLFACIVAVMNYFLLFRDTYTLYLSNPPASVYMIQHFMNNNFYKLNYQRLSTAAFLAELFLSALVVLVLLAQKGAKKHVE